MRLETAGAGEQGVFPAAFLATSSTAVEALYNAAALHLQDFMEDAQLPSTLESLRSVSTVLGAFVQPCG